MNTSCEGTVETVLVFLNTDYGVSAQSCRHNHKENTQLLITTILVLFLQKQTSSDYYYYYLCIPKGMITSPLHRIENS